jgi:hypothetical protein
MEYKNNFDKLTTLVKQNRNNIDKFELSDFISDIEDKLNKLKEATGLYNINPNEQMVKFHNNKFNDKFETHGKEQAAKQSAILMSQLISH